MLGIGKKGFTFIEIILIVLMIGALLSLALPNLRKTFTAYETESFVRNFETLTKYLSERAVCEKKIIYLNVDADNKELWGTFDPEGPRLKTIKIPDSLTVETGKEKILFYPDGRIDKVTVSIISSSGEEIVLTTLGVFHGFKNISARNR